MYYLIALGLLSTFFVGVYVVYFLFRVLMVYGSFSFLTAVLFVGFPLSFVVIGSFSYYLRSHIEMLEDEKNVV